MSETRRTNALAAVAVGTTWSRGRVSLTASNPQTRYLNGSRVFSVEVSAVRDGQTVYEDRINFPNPPLNVRNADGTSTYNPLGALRIIIEQEVERATRNFTGTRLERNADGTFRGDTLVVFATEDGYVSSNNASITSARSGSNLTVTTTSPNRVQATLAASVYYFRTAYMAFDTSALGAGATITASVLSLAGNGTAETNADSISMLAQYYDYGAGDPATGDWINLTTSWAGLVDVGSFTVSGWDQTSNAYNAFSDSGNYSSIAKAGITRIVVGTSLHPSGTPTGNNQVEFHASEAAGTTGDPKLTIQYTPPAPSGTIAATLQKALFSGTGVQTQTGTIAATLQKATAAFTSTQTQSGTAAATMRAATFAGSGTQTAGPTGTISSVMQRATASLTGSMVPTGAILAAMKTALFSGTALHSQTGAFAATLQKALFSGAGAQTQTGIITAALQRSTFAAIGSHAQVGAIVAIMRFATLSGVGEQLIFGGITSAFRPLLFTGSGTHAQIGTISATLQSLVFAAVGQHITTTDGQARFVPISLGGGRFAAVAVGNGRYSVITTGTAAYRLFAEGQAHG